MLYAIIYLDKHIAGEDMLTVDEIFEVHKGGAGWLDFCNLQDALTADYIQIFVKYSHRQVGWI